MGRQPRFSRDQLLDAALELFAEGGVEAVTMAGVARRAKAPTGSVYHRFDGRPDLLSALWLRTAQRFQQDWTAVLGQPGDPRQVARAAVRHTLHWARDHHIEARILLLHRVEDFLREEVDPATRKRADALRAQMRSAMAAFRARLGAGMSERRIRLALLDLPHALLRPDLAVGRPPPASVQRLADEVLDALL